MSAVPTGARWLESSTGDFCIVEVNGDVEFYQDVEQFIDLLDLELNGDAVEAELKKRPVAVGTDGVVRVYNHNRESPYSAAYKFAWLPDLKVAACCTRLLPSDEDTFMDDPGEGAAASLVELLPGELPAVAFKRQLEADAREWADSEGAALSWYPHKAEVEYNGEVIELAFGDE